MTTRRLSMNEKLKNARIFDSDSDDEPFVPTLDTEKPYDKGANIKTEDTIEEGEVKACSFGIGVSNPVTDEDSSSTSYIENSLTIKQEIEDNYTEEVNASYTSSGHSASSLQSVSKNKSKKIKTEDHEDEKPTSWKDIEMQTPVKKEDDYNNVDFENESLSGLYIRTPAKVEDPEPPPEALSEDYKRFKDVIVAKRRLTKPESVFSRLGSIDEQESQVENGCTNIFSVRRSARARGSPYKLPENENSYVSSRRAVKRDSPYKKPDEVIQNMPVTKRNSSRYYGDLNTYRDPDQAIPNKRLKKQEMESDPEVLARRQKQIDFGKNTIGYDNYLRQIPKDKRSKSEPGTPDKYRKYSRRGWDGLIRQWRVALHKYDPAEAEDDDKEEMS